MPDTGSGNEPRSDQQKPSGSAKVLADINVPKDSRDDPDSKALKSLFKIALETRNFEISQLVQRNNFFMIFQGVLFSGLVQSSHNTPVVSFLVCLVGLVVSWYQVQMAAGAKFWQEYWEAALQKIEEMLLIHLGSKDKRETLLGLFHGDSQVYEKMVRNRLGDECFNLANRFIMKRYSVSRVPIYVACALGLIWFLLMLCAIQSYPPFSIPSFIVGFSGVPS